MIKKIKRFIRIKFTRFKKGDLLKFNDDDRILVKIVESNSYVYLIKNISYHTEERYLPIWYINENYSLVRKKQRVRW